MSVSGEDLVPVHLDASSLEELEPTNVQGGVVVAGHGHLLGLADEEVQVVHGGNLGLDVFQVTYEWPDKDLTVVYNATLANNHRRGQIYFGDEATMDLTHGVDVYADPQSKQYIELIKKGSVKLDEPMVSYRNVAGKGIEAITSATAQWTVAKGLLYTYRGGRMISTTYLHLKNWIDHIRDNNPNTMCDITDGFQEAITAHMATMSLLKGCRTRWDPVNDKVICDLENKYEEVMYGQSAQA